MKPFTDNWFEVSVVGAAVVPAVPASTSVVRVVFPVVLVLCLVCR